MTQLGIQTCLGCYWMCSYREARWFQLHCSFEIFEQSLFRSIFYSVILHLAYVLSSQALGKLVYLFF